LIDKKLTCAGVGVICPEAGKIGLPGTFGGHELAGVDRLDWLSVKNRRKALLN